jgi:hypothetical protein
MREILFKSPRLLLGALVFLLALCAAGCTTTFLEYSGKMANQGSNNHVKPYQGASTQDNGNAEAVRPVVRMPSSSHLAIHYDAIR